MSWLHIIVPGVAPDLGAVSSQFVSSVSLVPVRSLGFSRLIHGCCTHRCPFLALVSVPSCEYEEGRMYPYGSTHPNPVTTSKMLTKGN